MGSEMCIRDSDYIIISAFGDSVIAPLTFIDDNFLWYETTSGDLRVMKKFNNNKTSDDYGTPNAYQPSSGSSALSTAEANKSLKDYVDAGNVGYYAGVSANASSSGGSNSAILPSSSILQKVYKDGGTKTDVAGEGTEIISVEITPKSADSILLCTFNANYQEKDQSAQQAQFHMNDVPFGGKLYCLSQDIMVREMVSLISKIPNTDLTTKTISVKIVSDTQEPTNFGSTFITVEEISTSDYFLSSSSTGGSSSSGGSSSKIDYAFCKAHINSSVRLRHTQWNFMTPDADNLSHGSKNYVYDAGSEFVGLRPPVDGYYHIQGMIQYDGYAGLHTQWTKTTQQRVIVYKRNISEETNDTLFERTEAKDNTLNGILTVEINEPNVYLTTNDLVYAKAYIYNSSYTGTNYPLNGA